MGFTYIYVCILETIKKFSIYIKYLTDENVLVDFFDYIAYNIFFYLLFIKLTQLLTVLIITYRYSNILRVLVFL